MRQYASQNMYDKAPAQKKQPGGGAVSVAKIMQAFRKDAEAMAGIRDNSKTLQSAEMEKQTIQQKRNNTGLPDTLKSGVENLSGLSMDDVRVHYNSDKPTQMQAHAYAQGTDIHVAPGQEKHLPHEAWHVVQQKQGRVRPTMQLQGANVNDDKGLENEADVMGGKALQAFQMCPFTPKYSRISPNQLVQRILQRYKFDCTATVEGDDDIEFTARAENSEAFDSLNIFSLFKLYRLLSVRQIKPCHPVPGSCAEPKALAKALLKYWYHWHKINKRGKKSRGRTVPEVRSLTVWNTYGRNDDGSNRHKAFRCHTCQQWLSDIGPCTLGYVFTKQDRSKG